MEENRLEKFVVELQLDSDQFDAYRYAMDRATRGAVATSPLVLERYGYGQLVAAELNFQTVSENMVREFSDAFAAGLVDMAIAMASLAISSDLLGDYVAGFDTEAIEPAASPPRSEVEFLAQRRAQLRADQQAKGRNRVKPWEAPAKRFR